MKLHKKTVLFVANRGFALTNSRILLIKHFLNKGWKVVGVTSKDQHSQKLIDLGVEIEPINFSRGGLSLRKDLLTLKDLKNIIHKHSPQLIHIFHAKPMILGNLAIRLSKKNPITVNTVTGLGNAFTSSLLIRKLSEFGYKKFLSKDSTVIFQNPDDMNFFTENAFVSSENAYLILGSGVDIEKFYQKKEKEHDSYEPVVLMASRLLWQKGVKEFVEAAQIVKAKYPKVRFQLAGEFDLDHPDSVDEKWIKDKENKGIIEFLGYINEMNQKLPEVAIFTLPSYYREGVPRVLLEASSCGVPVITTDSPGCREAVVDNKTGLLVPPKDSNELAKAIVNLIDDESKLKKMGSEARKMMEEKFDIRKITEQQLNIYRKLGVNI